MFFDWWQHLLFETTLEGSDTWENDVPLRYHAKSSQIHKNDTPLPRKLWPQRAMWFCKGCYVRSMFSLFCGGGSRFGLLPPMYWVYCTLSIESLNHTHNHVFSSTSFFAPVRKDKRYSKKKAVLDAVASLFGLSIGIPPIFFYVFPCAFVSAIVYSLLTECDIFTCLVSTLAYIYLYMLYVYGFCRSFLSKLLLMNHLSLTCFSLIRLSTMILVNSRQHREWADHTRWCF